jgi:hypothetical protein
MNFYVKNNGLTVAEVKLGAENESSKNPIKNRNNHLKSTKIKKAEPWFSFFCRGGRTTDRSAFPFIYKDFKS